MPAARALPGRTARSGGPEVSAVAPSGGPEYAVRRAAPALRGAVAGYSGYRMGDVEGWHRALPSPFLTLIVTLDGPLTVSDSMRDPRAGRAAFDTLVGGLHTVPGRVEVRPGQAGVQVALHPLRAATLLGVPAGELTGRTVDLGAVTGPWAPTLHERLALAPDWGTRFDLLDAAFTARATRAAAGCRTGPAAELGHAWSRLAAPGRDGDGASVARVAAETGWSVRRLHAAFRRDVGLAPAQLRRVARFDRARRALFADGSDVAPALARIATDHGYYDQAHLARDFRELAGCPPSELFTSERRFVQGGDDGSARPWTHDHS